MASLELQRLLCPHWATLIVVYWSGCCEMGNGGEGLGEAGCLEDLSGDDDFLLLGGLGTLGLYC